MRSVGKIIRSALGNAYDSIPFKGRLLSNFRSLGLPHNIYQHLHFTGDFVVQTPVRPFRLVHYGYEIENELFWEGLPGRRERVSMRLWMELSKRAAVVFDIGANTGVYSLVAKAMNPRARVFGFEPVLRVYDKFRRNCTLNAFDITAMAVALSNHNGTAILYDYDVDHVCSASLNPMIYAECARVPVEVPVRTFESIIEGEPPSTVDLVKIDVEAHEPEVLEGMGSYLARFRPTFLIEILSDEIGSRVETLIAPHAYLYFDIDETRSPRQVSHISQGHSWNYLLCQPSVARDLGLVN